MKSTVLFGIAAAGLLSFGAASFADPAGEKVGLKPKFVVGDVARFDVSMESRRKSQIEGREESLQLQKLAQEVWITRRVIAADEHGATLSLVYDRVTILVFAENKILNFDSAKPASEDKDAQLSPSARAAVGLPLTIKVDNDGKVLSIEGNEEPEDKGDGKPKAPVPAPTLVGDEVLRKVLRPIYGLENAPATGTVGTTWKTEEINPRPPIGTLTVDVTSTIKEIAAGIATIATTGDVKLSPAAGSMAIKADLNGSEIKATTMWDGKLGSLKSFVSSQKVVIAADDATGAKRTLESVAEIKITRMEAGTGGSEPVKAEKPKAAVPTP